MSQSYTLRLPQIVSDKYTEYSREITARILTPADASTSLGVFTRSYLAAFAQQCERRGISVFDHPEVTAMLVDASAGSRLGVLPTIAAFTKGIESAERMSSPEDLVAATARTQKLIDALYTGAPVDRIRAELQSLVVTYAGPNFDRYIDGLTALLDAVPPDRRERFVGAVEHIVVVTGAAFKPESLELLVERMKTAERLDPKRGIERACDAIETILRWSLPHEIESSRVRPLVTSGVVSAIKGVILHPLAAIGDGVSFFLRLGKYLGTEDLETAVGRQYDAAEKLVTVLGRDAVDAIFETPGIVEDGDLRPLLERADEIVRTFEAAKASGEMPTESRAKPADAIMIDRALQNSR